MRDGHAADHNPVKIRFAVLTLLVPALTVGCASAESGVIAQAGKASVAQIDALFHAAAQAEAEHRASAGSYTADVGTLRAGGLNIPPGVSLTVPRADATGYCLQATGGVVGIQSWHLESARQTPLRGPCPN